MPCGGQRATGPMFGGKRFNLPVLHLGGEGIGAHVDECYLFGKVVGSEVRRFRAGA